MSDVYNAAREFLARAREGTAQESDGDYKRRIGVLPYAVLEATPGVPGILGGPGDDEDPGSDEGPSGECVYNLSNIVNATCAQLTAISGTFTCAPPYIVLPISTTFDPLVVRYEGDGAFTCGQVSSAIEDIPGGELSSAGVWAGGTQPSESVEAVLSKTGPTTCTIILYQNGIALSSASSVPYASGKTLLLVIDAANLVAIVYYGGVSYILNEIVALTPGYTGILAASKGHRQTFSLVDCRCSA